LFISMKRRGPISFNDLTKDLERNYDVKWWLITPPLKEGFFICEGIYWYERFN
jgi:hypothetical protein